MKALKNLSILCGALLLLAACHPKIYVYNVAPRSIGPDDPIHISWKVKGTALLKINDINYPGTDSTSLVPINLLITMNGKTTTLRLHSDSSLKIQIAAEDSLTLTKKPDNSNDDRLRYITLVVSKNGQDSSRVVQVAVRPNAAKDEIAFRTIIRGDSLVAGGINNPIRWGNNFDILTVSDGSNRAIDVWHSNINRLLQPDGSPDKSFEGTLVKGNWIFRTLMTPAEKSDHHLVPNFLKLAITLKHH